MNYTNNVRCDQVKPLERKLFRYLCRQIDYSQFAHDQYVVNNIQEKLSFFKDKYGIGQSMISYYILKWAEKGICCYEKYGKTFKKFYFRFFVSASTIPRIRIIPNNFNRITCAQLDRIAEYEDMIPSRCETLIIRNRKFGNERGENNDTGRDDKAMLHRYINYTRRKHS